MKQMVWILALPLMFACSSKQKKMDVDAANSSALTPNISNEPLNFSVQGSDTGKIAGLNTIHFDFDQATIDKGAMDQLRQNAGWIKDHSEAKIQIEGHCDSRGTQEYNLALGERRAKSVQHALQGMGIPKSRMTTISYGEERPLDTADTDEAFAKNRRANFLPVSDGKPIQPLAAH